MGRIASAIVVAAIILALALFLRPATEGPRGEVHAQAPSSAARNGPLAPDSVLSIAPRIASQAPVASGFRLSPDVREYYARNYASLYARLSKGPRTPDGNWILGHILDKCAMVADERPRGNAHPIKEVLDARRAKFAAALPSSDPDRQKRLDAFDIAWRNPCEGLGQLKSTRAEIEQLYRDGAAAGDAKSGLALIREDVQAQFRDRTTPNGTPFMPKLDNDQIAAIRQALASSDPTTALEALDSVSFGFANANLRDADGRSVNLNALRSAAILVACDAGYPCGLDNPDFARPCAYNGECDATTFRDYMLYYALSPHDSQLLARYESALRNAAATGDPSFFEFAPGPMPSVAQFQ